jgi:uncharacterized protein (UPF0264 family)
MLQLIDREQRPGLLISVRDAREALVALAGGADVIDVKEPSRGSLGAADVVTIGDVVRAVRGRAPLTAAVGELIDMIDSPHQPLPDGVSLFKIGLARCHKLTDWRSRWLEKANAIWPHAEATTHAVAVVYADWKIAHAPEPGEVLRFAVDVGCPAVLVDTWDKSSGNLFDHWPANDLVRFMESVHAHGLMRVLAGSLIGESFTAAVRLGPELLAVRTAACESGRGGTVSRERVVALSRIISDARPVIT